MWVKATLITLGVFNFILGVVNFTYNRKALREEKRQTNMIEEVKA